MAIDTKTKRWSMANVHGGAFIRRFGGVATNSDDEAKRIHRVLRYNGNGLDAPGGGSGMLFERAAMTGGMDVMAGGVHG
jgi:hypothetical protein